MLLAGSAALAAAPGGASAPAGGMPWWAWPLLLFVGTFLLGIVAVLGGVGGGVLFVPIVGSFFPFHLDYVRGASLFVALSGALAAGPRLLQQDLANLRLALPAALIASTFSIVGAFAGLALPERVVQTALGITILFIFTLFLVSRSAELPRAGSGDLLAAFLRIQGAYVEGSTGKVVSWSVWRTPQGFALFSVVGLVAGMFGLGAGWANVPVLNLLMGAPLKVAVGTSVFLLSITDTSAAWIYLNRGAVLPIITVPSILGMMLGASVGARLLPRARPRAVRGVVLAMLLAAGLRSLLKGLGIWS